MARRSRARCVRSILGVLAAATVLLAACGEGDDAGSVQPFSEVQATEFVFEADPTALDRGVFRVTTTEPMICAIVWGETEALGNFNNSLAMSGTGIVEHDVFLPGVEAGRTYHFRVQGSTADGTLYQSDLGTFTIEEVEGAGDAASSRDGETNLALEGDIVDVSSEFDDNFAAANAIDGLGTTEWSTAGDGDDAFIVVDLGARSAIGGVEFVTRAMADGTAITETYTVTVDGGEPLGPFPAATAAVPEVAEIDAEGQVVRFDVETSTGGNVGAVEIRVLAR